MLQKITSCKYNQGVTEHHSPLYVLNVNFFRLSVAKVDANFYPEITKPSPQITAPKVSYAKPPKSEPHHILLKPDSNNIYSFHELIHKSRNCLVHCFLTKKRNKNIPYFERYFQRILLNPYYHYQIIHFFFHYLYVLLILNKNLFLYFYLYFL